MYEQTQSLLNGSNEKSHTHTHTNSSFLKILGLSAVFALLVAGGSAFDIKSNEFSVQTGDSADNLDVFFHVAQNGPVEIRNTDLDLNDNNIEGVNALNGVLFSDLATEEYVDNQVSGDACPTGYIRVPGSNKYGTSDFCVMEFEATDDGSGNPISDATSDPWVSIEWYDAKEACESQGSNYGLISEREWMTVAENIMRQESNWADGNIGSTASSGGGLYMGNVDPESDSADHGHLGYGYGSADSRDPGDRPDTANHVLSNGETIWDFSGNVRSWTDHYIRGNEQPEPATNGWYEYTEISDFNGLTPNARPSNPDWSSDQGIGRIYARDDSATDTRAVDRGGHWTDGLHGGVLTLTTHTPSHTYSGIGFRCSYSVS